MGIKALNKLKDLTQELSLAFVNEEEELCDSSIYTTVTTILNFAPVLCEIVTVDHELIFVNRYTKDFINKRGGQKIVLGKACYQTIWGRDKVCENCLVDRAIKNKEIFVENKIVGSQDDIEYHVVAIPLRHNGTSAVLILASCDPMFEVNINFSKTGQQSCGSGVSK